ncbi:MAG: FxSxx-COOH system tetratricopeptide repeat protein [Bryobacterales bacterium]
MSETAQKKHFFVSYTGADSQWAEWIAWHLEANGYTVVIQAWDFRPGSNFVLDMDSAAALAERTIAVLSPRYHASKFTQPEWAAAFARDPTGEKGLLLPVQIEKSQLDGLLRQIVHIDLAGLSKQQAQERLLQGVRFERTKPNEAPPFPVETKVVPDGAPGFPGRLPDLFNLPHHRNPNFTGRDELLRGLREALNGGGAAALTQAVHGLGGVGKTQLAVEYVYRFASNYSLVWWVRSETVESRNADYETLAKRLKLFPGGEQAEQGQVIEAVRGALETRDGWLVVFDNVPEPKSIDGYRPRGGGGHVVVTSRHAAWGGVARPLKVNVWKSEDSVRFLLSRTGREEEKAAGELAQELGYLPLALEQAAAYVEHAGISLANYLNLFRERLLELFEDERLAEAEPTVTTTWEISFRRVREIFPPAADLLNLCAFFAPDDIPLEVIVEGAENLPQCLADTVRDSLALNRTIGLLSDHSLVEVEAGHGGHRRLSLHRLVQAVTRDRLSQRELPIWLRAAANVVNYAFPNEPSEPYNWSKSELLSPHAARIADHSEWARLPLESVSRLLNQLGVYAWSRADLTQAKSRIERALAIDEQIYGPHHLMVGIRANNIGQILQEQGDLSGALDWTRRSLSISEKANGPDHPEVAIRANNIGSILKEQGDLDGALQWSRRALAINEKVNGPDHPDVARYSNNIGQILKAQGKLDKALELTRRALAIFEKAYGASHPRVAAVTNNIGTILLAQGDQARALKCFRLALEIDESVYGPDHPTVARDANNIGQILRERGDRSGALELSRRALAIDERVYGIEHPEVATDVENVGRILFESGDPRGALECVERAWKIRMRFLGPKHDLTKQAELNLHAIRRTMR